MKNLPILILLSLGIIAKAQTVYKPSVKDLLYCDLIKKEVSRRKQTIYYSTPNNRQIELNKYAFQYDSTSITKIYFYITRKTGDYPDETVYVTFDDGGVSAFKADITWKKKDNNKYIYTCVLSANKNDFDPAVLNNLENKLITSIRVNQTENPVNAVLADKVRSWIKYFDSF